MRATLSVAIVTVACLAGAVIISAPAFAENKAEGKLKVDGKTVEINHVVAYSTPGFFDKKKRDVVVLMCDAPVSVETARDPFGIRDQVKAGELHCVRHTINEDKQVISFEVSHNSFRMPAAGASSYEAFESKTFTGGLIAGRSFTKSPQKSAFDNIPYEYDITFSADIAAPQSRKVGTKLPADGGELFKVYLARIKRIRTMDLKEMRGTMPEGMSGETSDEELKAMKELAVAMMPKNPRYNEGYVKGDRAVLFITDHAGKEKRFGTVDMIKDNGQWAVENEDWSDTPPE